ncbi:MAG: triose-phosphate isomerase [Halobacteriovoraceae bacterium]|nr:triose-phosphate isomerase [Halobacteriovoraceae bacterium]MCB9095789.1 triose-phosphate isomerase [Halobacteriovoraceae bacterium]
MKRKLYCLGNWKMNHLVQDALQFCKEIQNVMKSEKTELGIAAQAIHLPLLLENLQKTPVLVGAQNSSEHKSGAYTGEISPEAIKDLGCQFVLIGHSERRQYYGETSQNCLEKIRTALAQNLIVVYCIGETLQEYEAGQTEQVLKTQLNEGLIALLNEQKDLGKIVIAYEPVWAIGTGKVATPEIVAKNLKAIRNHLGSALDAASQLSLLYGGSVKPENIDELMKIEDMDGALIGGASLKAQAFAALFNSIDAK